ncbi:MAG TPA: DUF6065 family protein, partial [Pirellulaceae bacterium]|nr:DUF6065 family protein [Pirellulaceae bacterium]
RLIYSRFTKAGIYVVRNPLDVVDSLADHTNKSIDEAIDLMNDPGHRLGKTEMHAAQFVGTWSHHVRTWTNNENEFPLIVLRYEDLKDDPFEHFGRLIKFLGWDYDADRVRRAVEQTAFPSLQEAEQAAGFAEASTVARSGRFFRHGENGRWRNVLNSRQAARVIAHHREVMEMFGYELPHVAKVSGGRLPKFPNALKGSRLSNGGKGRRPAVERAGEVGRPAPSGESEVGRPAPSKSGNGDVANSASSKSARDVALLSSSTTEGDRRIIAYEIYEQTDMPLTPALIARPWMDQTQQRFAYRCLPLTLANQAGWVIGNPTGFTAYWNGGARPEDVVLTFDNRREEKRISGLFGHGVVTFNMPYLFRTPENVNLWVKGPT